MNKVNIDRFIEKQLSESMNDDTENVLSSVEFEDIVPDGENDSIYEMELDEVYAEMCRRAKTKLEQTNADWFYIDRKSHNTKAQKERDMKTMYADYGNPNI